MRKKYIISNPEILSGMPTIAGTRVPIARILYLVREGKTLTEIQKHFPHLSITTLKAVIQELAVSLDSTHHGTKVL